MKDVLLEVRRCCDAPEQESNWSESGIFMVYIRLEHFEFGSSTTRIVFFRIPTFRECNISHPLRYISATP